MNQLHFLHRILEEDNYYLGSYFKEEITEYESIAEGIISSYESFFNEELETNLHIDILKEDELEEVSNKDIKRLIDVIRNPDKEDYVIRNDSIIRKHLMLVKGEINKKEVYIVMSSSEYEFGMYEMKIILSLLELSRIICEKITILDTIVKDE